MPKRVISFTLEPEYKRQLELIAIHLDTNLSCLVGVICTSYLKELPDELVRIIRSDKG